MEACWQHAHDLPRNIAEPDSGANRARITMEQVLPQRISQNRDVLVALDAVLGNKCTAQKRMYPENVEEIRSGNNRAGEARMFGGQCQSHRSVLQVGQTTESGGALAPDLDVPGIGACGIITQKPDALPASDQAAALVKG